MCDWTIASELVATYHKVFAIPGEAPVVAETVHVTTLPCGRPVFPAGPGPVQFHPIHPRLLTRRLWPRCDEHPNSDDDDVMNTLLQ